MIKSFIKKKIKSITSNNYQTLNRIEISRTNIVHNFNQIKKMNPHLGIMCVLKANAYGHGLSQMAEILNDTTSFFLAVDGYFEASRIKDITKHKILVMGYILPENARLLDLKKCSLVVQDVPGLRALARLRKKANIHLELNTGMNRLGLQPDELPEYLAELGKHPQLNLEGVMTHLADADNINPGFTTKQTKQFDSFVEQILAKGFKPKYFHIAQTAGSTKVKSKYANSLRLGIGLYGINPLNPADPKYSSLSSLKPALGLKSTIIKTMELKPGEKISYNGIYSTDKKSRIGVLPLGYYEGMPRELSNIGIVTVGPAKLPIRGRVCMDHTMIDISGTNLKVGDKVTVISSDKSMPNSVENIAKQYGLFTYSLLTGLSESVRREIT